VFEAGKPFQCVENSELHQYVRSSQLFRRVSSAELQVNGDGSVSIEPPEKMLANADRASTVNEDAEEAIRGATNASWSDIEEASSAQLMRHASHGGKRSGNER
jgi:hypothetical protein